MSARVVFVEKEDCTSCNQCASRLPRFFQMDADDTAESHVDGSSINQAPIPVEYHDDVQREVDDCPGECIHWKD